LPGLFLTIGVRPVGQSASRISTGIRLHLILEIGQNQCATANIFHTRCRGNVARGPQETAEVCQFLGAGWARNGKRKTTRTKKRRTPLGIDTAKACSPWSWWHWLRLLAASGRSPFPIRAAKACSRRPGATGHVLVREISPALRGFFELPLTAPKAYGLRGYRRTCSTATA